MNLAITMRLLWKEVRVQRGLWLVILVAGLLFDVVAYASLRPSERAGSILGIGVIVTALYAVASGGITFAPEREDGTQLRLLTLAPPAGSLFFAKVSVAFLGLVSLMAAFLGIVSCVWTEPLRMTHPDAILMATMLGVLGMLSAQCWGVFWSLWLRSSLAALFVAAISALSSVIAITASVEEWRRSQYGYGASIPDQEILTLQWQVAAFGVLVTLLTTCSVFLTFRWLKLDPGDGRSSRLSTKVLEFVGGEGAIEALVSGRFMSEPAPGVKLTEAELAQLPIPSIGLRWLYFRWSNFSRRTGRFLRWREARDSRGWLCAILAVGLFGAIQVLNHWSYQLHGVDLSAFQFCGFMVAGFLGAMTFRSQYRDNQFQFLRDRGITARRVWWEATRVSLRRFAWLSLMSVGFIAACTPYRYVRHHPESFFMPGGDSGPPYAFAWLGEFGLWLVPITWLVAYSIGQVGSLLVKRSIVAIFLSMFFTALTYLWLCFARGVLWIPFSISALPLLMGGILVTYLRAPGWYLERNHARAWVKPFVAIALMIVVPIFGTCVYRVWEIPTVAQYFRSMPPQRMLVLTSSYSVMQQFVPRAQVFDFESPLTIERRARALRPISETERTAAGLLLRAMQFTTKPPVGFDQKSVVWSQLPKEHQEWVRSMTKAREFALEATKLPECAFYAPREVPDDTLNRFERIKNGRDVVQLVALTGSMLLADGRPDEALNHFEAALTLVRHFQSRGMLRSDCRGWDQPVFAEIIQWANDARVTDVLRKRGLEILHAYYEKAPTDADAWFLHAEFMRGAVDAATSIVVPTREYENAPILAFLRLIPTERWRAFRLIDLAEHGASNFDDFPNWIRTSICYPTPLQWPFDTFRVQRQRDEASVKSELLRCLTSP